MHTKLERLLPVSGALAGLALALSLGLTLGAPSVDDGLDKYAAWFGAHQIEAKVSAIAAVFFSAFMIIFAATLRERLRSDESAFANVAFGGAITVATAISTMAALGWAAAQAAAHDARAAVDAVGFIADVSWVPWAAGCAAMLLTVGLGGLRTLALPRPLCFVSIALGAVCLTPAGSRVFLVMPLWLIATTVSVSRGDCRPAARTSVTPARAA